MTDVVIPDECQSMPITRTQGLEPERVAQSREKGVTAVMVENALGNGGAERDHPVGKPRGNATAMQREIRDARSLHPMIVDTFP